MLSIHSLRLHGWFKASWLMAGNSFYLLLWQKCKRNELQFYLDTPARFLTPFVEFIRSRWHFKLSFLLWITAAARTRLWNQSCWDILGRLQKWHRLKRCRSKTFIHHSLWNISAGAGFIWAGTGREGGDPQSPPSPEFLPSRWESRLMWNEHFHETVWWMSVCGVVTLWLIISPMMNY